MQTQVEELVRRAAPQILRAILENKVTRTSLERGSGGTAKTGHRPPPADGNRDGRYKEVQVVGHDFGLKVARALCGAVSVWFVG